WLAFVTNQDIVMASEELFISAEQIRAVYQFRNDGAEDQNVLVAFLMPDIVPSLYSLVAFPQGPDDNLFEFETRFEGQPVDATLHQYAYVLGVDRTKMLTQLGLPLVPISAAASAATDALDEETQARLLHLGLPVPDEYDDGDGMKKHMFPAWTYRATYTWEANFPADNTVEVVHTYTPSSVGITVGVSFLSESADDYDPARDYAHKYCTDSGFIAAVRKTLANPEEPWSAPFSESWISYILSTGCNWVGNGIEHFRLVVDKGYPKNLASFCGEGSRKSDRPLLKWCRRISDPNRNSTFLFSIA
ncbi:MAG: DUF4424 domain-containing protein, partial [Candidatus Devosia euplotis]|nr:DUF4424 domain-containing protein [Candidatus Devosia euplotis]